MLKLIKSSFLGCALLAGVPVFPGATGSCACRSSRDRELRQAMDLAEADTGGAAVRARRVELGGTHTRGGLPGGVEVLVRMPEGEQGWRCLIDVEVMKVRRKVPVPNPPKPRRRGQPRANFMSSPARWRVSGPSRGLARTSVICNSRAARWGASALEARARMGRLANSG